MGMVCWGAPENEEEELMPHFGAMNPRMMMKPRMKTLIPVLPERWKFVESGSFRAENPPGVVYCTVQ